MKRKVFLSHNSADKPAVEALALRLRAEADIEPWLDKWNLIPGQPWQEELEVAIKGCDSCVIFIGRGDPQSGVIGPWQNAEMRALISRQVSGRGSKFAVIPVLLPGAERGQRSTLPTFLVASTWVEFRRTLDEPDALLRLLSGIRGEKPGAPSDGHPALGACPYRGLEFFDVSHADRFFGREAVTQWLVDDIRKPLRPGSELPRFLAILGASGSGKSSLARAGLYAALREGIIEGSRDWLFVPPLRPGPNPLESLELAVLQAAAGSPQLEAVRHELRELADQPDRLHRAVRLLVPDTAPPRRLFLLVDQFEEVFTTCEKEDLRRAFIAALLHAARERGGPVVVALTMRADFFGKVAAYEELARTFDQHQFLVGPMSEAELRLAIEEPALRAGAEFEPGLVDTLLEDVHRQPGALALLQHALLELWNRKEDGRRLTHAAYEAIGRLEGALERRANEVFGQFSADDQELCRRAFLRLVHPGEGAEDTRRRVEFRELLALGDGTRMQNLIATLAAPDARLVVTEGGDARQQGGFVEVAHETLIRSWSQLRQWLDADRAGLRTQRRLTEAAREWDEGGRKPGFLYAEGRLVVAKEWAARNADELNALEDEFLKASEQQQEEHEAEKARIQNEKLKAAEELAATQGKLAAEQVSAREQAEKAAARARQQLKIAAALGSVALACAVAALLFFKQARRDRETAFFQEGQAKAATKVAQAREEDARQQKAAADTATVEATKQARLAKEEEARALDLIRFMDSQVGEAFIDAVPVQLRERVSAEVDAFYTSHGALAALDEQKRMSYYIRKAQVHLDAVTRYEQESFKELFIPWERDSAAAALKEALRLGDTLAAQAGNNEKRSITRDRILAHFHFARLSTQLEDAKAATEHLQAARALLDALVQAGPFPEVELVDWMGLPNLDAAMGDRTAAEGHKEAARVWYQKALDLQTLLVARSPAEQRHAHKQEEIHIPKAKTRKEVLEEIKARLKENSPKQPSKTRKP